MKSLNLFVLTNPKEGREDEYNDWYSNQHLQDIVGIDGFTAAQRFRFLPGKLGSDCAFQYLAVYEVEGMTQEEAEAALAAALAEPGRMSSTTATGSPRAMWWFESIGDRVEAGASDGQ